jgi:hypothetical protein
LQLTRTGPTILTRTKKNLDVWTEQFGLNSAYPPFGPNTIELTDDYRDNFGKGRSREYYKAIKGRELNRFEIIASHDEYDNLFLEALVAYVAKGYGIDFYNFTTTLRRVPTLREGGHRYILEDLARRNLISQPPKDQGFYGDNLKAACSELETKTRN